MAPGDAPSPPARSADPPPPTPLRDGRRHAPRAVARLEPLPGGRVALRSPGVGWLLDPPLPGALVTPGDRIGDLEVLGVRHALVAPAGARGLVVVDASHGSPPAEPGVPRPARRGVDWDAPFLVLDPEAAGEVAAEAAAQEAAAGGTAALVFRAPSSGRYYARPSPDEPPYVAQGDVVTAGQTVGLLEVMKTFSRMTYGGAGLPERARVLRVVPPDESDLDQGAVVLELEPA